MDMLFGSKKPTPEEILAAAPKRAAFRVKVVADQDAFAKLEPILLEANVKSSDLSEYKQFIQESLAWINANIDVNEQQIFSKDTQYTERLPEFQKKIENSLKSSLQTLDTPRAKKVISELTANNQSFFEKETLEAILKEKETSILQEEQKSKEDLENRGWFEDSMDALVIVGKVVGILAYIIIAIRVAAFSANAMLHKMPAYRILAFAYGFLFAPFLFFYYLYQEIFVGPPRFESLLPLFPYSLTPGESTPFFYTAFGYNETASLKAELTALQDKEKQSALDLLQKSTLYTDLLAAKGITNM